ncbi:MAG: CHAP domain-containing protein [Sphingomonadaceae bacterium]|nr:CHAP domain-containing protein [Sphingomonadaceae bacterium]
MAIRFHAILAALTLALTTALPTAAHAQYWQCVAFARETTGVAIRGNANTWWGQAEGRYDRGHAPKPGAILAFKSAPGMRAGHVAVVSKIVSDREVLLDHANWSRPGGIEHGVRAVDVSPEGDWSQVRVWYASLGDLGTRTNPTYGFIYPGDAPAAEPREDRAPLLSQDVIQLAMLESR